jgi:glutathione S-transferase
MNPSKLNARMPESGHEHKLKDRSPTVLAHEIARSQRMADLFEARVSEPLMKAEPGMAHLMVAVSLEMARKRGPGDLTNGRPQLAAWIRRISGLPAMCATALP